MWICHYLFTYFCWTFLYTSFWNMFDTYSEQEFWAIGIWCSALEGTAIHICQADVNSLHTTTNRREFYVLFYIRIIILYWSPLRFTMLVDCRCDFTVSFPEGSWAYVDVYCHFEILFCEMTVQVFCPFLCWWAFLLMLYLCSFYVQVYILQIQISYLWVAFF